MQVTVFTIEEVATYYNFSPTDQNFAFLQAPVTAFSVCCLRNFIQSILGQAVPSAILPPRGSAQPPQAGPGSGLTAPLMAGPTTANPTGAYPAPNPGFAGAVPTPFAAAGAAPYPSPSPAASYATGPAPTPPAMGAVPAAPGTPGGKPLRVIQSLIPFNASC